MKPNDEVIKRLYEEGRFGEASKLISKTYESLGEMPDEILKIWAWCHYRIKDYGGAKNAALILIERNHISGYEIQAQIAAYVDKDDVLLQKLYWKNTRNPGIANAVTIRARDNDSTIPTEVVICTATGLFEDDQIASAHVINNTARLIFERSSCHSSDHVVMALGFWGIALKKYGKGNFHHRAAVYFWISKAYQRLKMKKPAIENARKSVALWIKQVSLDPDNAQFKEKLAGAESWLEELKR